MDEINQIMYQNRLQLQLFQCIYGFCFIQRDLIFGSVLVAISILKKSGGKLIILQTQAMLTICNELKKSVYYYLGYVLGNTTVCLTCFVLFVFVSLYTVPSIFTYHDFTKVISGCHISGPCQLSLGPCWFSSGPCWLR